jgi:hypothetical protein
VVSLIRVNPRFICGLIFLPFPIDCDDVAIDRFYFDHFLDSDNTNEQDRVASISFPFKAAQ